jgi:NAD(P)-dependent dehydrogenase (short-subunit alcohol dehydrogenase family)
MQIEGIAAFVAGGGSGLGEATARLLAKRGARVTIFDLGRSRGAEVASEIGAGARYHEGDVTRADEIEAALHAAAGDFGPIRAVVNCAGIGSASRTVGKDGKPFDLDVFRRTIEVNLIGTFNVIRLAAARMVANDPDEGGERGVVINTASIAAFEGQIGQAAYSASKGGIVGMTLPIARDLARHGVRCCTIAPGLFDTPLLAGLPEPAREALGRSIPFPPRLGMPREYAVLACQIVENPMLNGETIRLDGALRMAPQ